MFVNDGYSLLQDLERQHRAMSRTQEPFDEDERATQAKNIIAAWQERVAQSLLKLFPTPREVYLFNRLNNYEDDDGSTPFHRFFAEIDRLERLIRGLDSIRLTELARYTDIAPRERLYIEDIDSFRRVRGTNPATVRKSLTNGRVELSEDDVQIALETILGISFHRIDWGGEINDLRATVVINGARRSAAFLLKGNGCRAPELTIAKCGKNGDQIVRLLDSPAELFVVQYVGHISDAVIRDLSTKVAAKRAQGQQAWFCVVDGDDTARLLRAYGLPLPRSMKNPAARRRK